MTSAYCGVCGRRYSECVCGIRPTERCLEHDRFVCDECKHIGKGRGPLMLSVSLNEWNAASERMKRLERVAEAAREWFAGGSQGSYNLRKALQDLDEAAGEKERGA